MAGTKFVPCREHGGTFEVTVSRGRYPVRCSEENPCDMVPKKRASGGRRPAKVSTAVAARAAVKAAEVRPSQTRSKSTLPTSSSLRVSRYCKCAQMDRERHERGIEGCKYATRNSPVVVRHNPSIQFAGTARERLAPLGWQLKGKAGFDDEGAWAEVTGSRGEETIYLRWNDGKLIDQTYVVWNSDATPGMNGKPRTRLPFDPSEMSDIELVRELGGRKVSWWNRIAQGKEHAIIGDKLEVQHNYTGGNEIARMIKFVDKGNGGFRAFHVDALMGVK